MMEQVLLVTAPAFYIVESVESVEGVSNGKCSLDTSLTSCFNQIRKRHEIWREKNDISQLDVYEVIWPLSVFDRLIHVNG